MHGLVNRSIQCFVRDTYGECRWAEIAQRMGLNANGFEAMLTYDDAMTQELVAVVTRQLDKTEDILLEDVGTYLSVIPIPRQSEGCSASVARPFQNSSCHWTTFRTESAWQFPNCPYQILSFVEARKDYTTCTSRGEIQGILMFSWACCVRWRTTTGRSHSWT